jgi:RimJ/RimL family protein N-acetyltransferase
VGDGDVLRGERVLLRPFTLDDVKPVVEACQDDEIHRWTVTIPWPYTEEHARSWIEAHAMQRRAGSAHHFAVVEAATNSFSGSISLERSAGAPRSAGAGYWIAPWARRRGYATDALRIIVDFAFAATDTDRILLVTMAGNEASEHVAAHAGFEVVGTDEAHSYGVAAGEAYPARIWERRRG